MDNGGYRFIYNDDRYAILDETEYFAVNLNYKQVAAFKFKEDAFEYVRWKISLENSGE